MGDSLKAIYDDIQNYLRLCRHYGEDPERDVHGVNPYGTHAEQLEQRQRQERA